MVEIKTLHVLSLLAFSVILVTADGEDGPIVLNDDTFEHLTQASTGATTGDWLVLFAKTKTCQACLDARQVFGNLNTRLKRKMNIATVDVDENKGLTRRFGIKKLPNVYLFRLGFQYNYLGEVNEEKLEQFALNGYRDYQKQAVQKPLSSFDTWKEDTIEDIMDSIKNRRLPSSTTLGIALAILVSSLLFLFVCCSGSTPEHEEETKKEQ